ncbi:MAG: hypothetical protein HRU09_11865 [Oligoflexales bacterium]|nr:hypothetical protein [Oligoflexales bacterium]
MKKAKIQNREESYKQTWALRSALKQSIRQHFEKNKYLEVDTPIGVLCPGTEVHLDYFETNWLDYRGKSHALSLRSSPELHMKQVLSHGLPRIFQFAPCFRNGGELSEWHNPEFIMLEWYEVGISFEGFIDETERLLRSSHATLSDRFGEEVIQLKFPEKLQYFTLASAFEEFAGIKLIDGDVDLAAKARQAGLHSPAKNDDFETAFFKVLIERIEPELARFPAVVLYDYPPSQAALARVEGGYAKRFEFYFHGVELCNGFFELLGSDDNRQRIRESNAQRAELGKPVPNEDEAFYAALDHGIPPCCGNALGFERWLAVLLGARSLDQVMPFRGQAPYCDDVFPGRC